MQLFLGLLPQSGCSPGATTYGFSLKVLSDSDRHRNSGEAGGPKAMTPRGQLCPLAPCRLVSPASQGTASGIATPSRLDLAGSASSRPACVISMEIWVSLRMPGNEPYVCHAASYLGIPLTPAPLPIPKTSRKTGGLPAGLPRGLRVTSRSFSVSCLHLFIPGIPPLGPPGHLFIRV